VQTRFHWLKLKWWALFLDLGTQKNIPGYVRKEQYFGMIDLIMLPRKQNPKGCNYKNGRKYFHKKLWWHCKKLNPVADILRGEAVCRNSDVYEFTEVMAHNLRHGWIIQLIL
jgi:hypothetical protein